MQLQIETTEEVYKYFESFANTFAKGDLALAFQLLIEFTKFNETFRDVYDRMDDLKKRVDKLEGKPEEDTIRTFGVKHG